MRRRIKLIILLSIVALVIFGYVRKEIFFQQAKELIRQNLEKNFPCQLSFERIEANLFYGLTLENLEINFPEISGLVFNIKVEQTCVDYNLWETFFLGRKKDVQQLRLISPTINVSYPPALVYAPSTNSVGVPSTNSGLLDNGSGPTNWANIRDFVLVLENGQISFGKAKPLFKNLHGRLLLNQNGLYLQDLRVAVKDNPSKTVKIYGDLSENHLSLTANLEHLKIDNFDILTNFALILNKKLGPQDKSPKFCGTLKTYGSVFNNRPFPELSSSFEIQDDKLRILTFSLGDNYDLRGIVSLSSPFNADISLNFYQATPNELIAKFTQSFLPTEKESEGKKTEFVLSQEPDFSGLINGLIKITGALSHPKVEGYLEVRDGHLGELDFVSADVNIKGRYPKILITNSRIYREEDSFIMEGEIDFTNLEGQDLVDIRVEADKAIFWRGWDITRSRDNNQVHMSKSIADDLKITFDTFIGEKNVGLEDNYQNELGLEYKILGDKVLKLRLRKEEEILGVERRIRF